MRPASAIHTPSYSNNPINDKKSTALIFDLEFIVPLGSYYTLSFTHLILHQQCGDYPTSLSGGFSDSDLLDVSKDDTYKPDKGKGNIWTFFIKKTNKLLLL